MLNYELKEFHLSLFQKLRWTDMFIQVKRCRKRGRSVFLGTVRTLNTDGLRLRFLGYANKNYIITETIQLEVGLGFQISKFLSAIENDVSALLKTAKS